MNKIFFIIPIIAGIVLLALPFLIYSDKFVMEQNSDSMYPAILPGDMLIIQRGQINDVSEGDIIAFETHAEGVEVLVRRVIEAAPGPDGRFGLDTKGDDEEFHDPWTVYSDTYIGKVVEINPPTTVLFSDYIQYIAIAVVIGSGILLVRESLPKKGMEVEKLRCYRCNYTWYPRIIDGKAKIPSTCPNKKCRSPYWNKPRQKEN